MTMDFEPLHNTGDTMVPVNPDVLPLLRFENGDLLVKLGKDQKDWLLLHRSRVMAAVPHLAGMLRWDWVAATQVTDATTGSMLQYYTISFKYVDNTIVLSEDKDVAPHANIPNHDFRRSELSEGWPTGDSLGRRRMKASRAAMIAHKALFSIVYEHTLSLEALFDETRRRILWWDLRDLDNGALGFATSMLCLIGAYAEYYGCLPRVAPVLGDMLLTHPHIWRAVDRHAPVLLNLATKLRHKEFYFDALRHVLSYPYEINIANLARIVGLTEVETADWVDAIIGSNNWKELVLARKLSRLHLSESSATSFGIESTSLTTYQNKLEFEEPPHTRKSMSEEAKAMERSKFLAKTIFTEWLAQQLHGEEVYFHDTQRSRKAGSMANVMQMLERAATWKNPADVFNKSGGGKSVAQQFAEDFAQGNQFNPEKQIEVALEELVIKGLAAVREEFPVHIEVVNGVRLTFRHTHFVHRTSEITYFGLDESAPPWEDKWVWPTIDDLPMPNLEPASEEKLRLLGIIGDHLVRRVRRMIG